MEFKVGDKVRFVKELRRHCPVLKIGDVTTITRICIDGDIELETNNICSPEELELVNNKPTKEELEEMPIGTRITTDRKNDNVFIKIENDETVFSSIEECDCLSSYDIEDDLTINDYDYGTKIVKIEVPTEYETKYDYSNEVKEMTIAEIEKELGYGVKIIKEEEK